MGRGFRTQQDMRPCFLPCYPSVFTFLPPQLRFPGPSFEHSSANIRRSLGRPSHGPARLAAPQPWRNPSSLQPGGAFPHLLCWEQSWGSQQHWADDPCCQTCTQTSSIGLGLPLPSQLLALPTQQPHKGWEDHLPILNTICLPSRSLLWANDPPPALWRQ